MNFSILIPTRNRPEILRRTLKELRRVGYGTQPLVVYDDASEQQHADAVDQVVKDEWCQAKLIRAQKRQGQAAGRNILLRSSPCELALCMDDDSFPESGDWIKRYLQVDWRVNRWAIATFQYKRLLDNELAIKDTVIPREVNNFLGGASMLHVPSVLAVGGYRDFFIYGFEEPELAMRLRFAGFKIWQDPQVIIMHNQFYSPEENRDYREYDFLYARNGVLISSLNLPFPFGLTRGVARSIRQLVSRRRNRWARLRGLTAGICMSFVHWEQRTPCSWGSAARMALGRTNW